MSRKKSEVNTTYFPIGTIALPPAIAEIVRKLAGADGSNKPGVAAVVRAALIHTYGAAADELTRGNGPLTPPAAPTTPDDF